MLAVRARALLEGRYAPSIDDVHRAGRAGAQAPHGADLRGARRRRDHRRRHRQAHVAHRVTRWRQPSATPRRSRRTEATRRATGAGALACRHDAAPDPGGAPGRRHHHPRPARPPPRRHRRELLAVPPLRLRRGGAPHRLAALGARRQSLCARARMGGRAHGVDLARPLAVDAVRLAARCARPSSTARWSSLSRWRRCWSRAASASACRA